MLNKNDPLIGAVQEVMKRNQAERDATKLVNEKFGITDRKALPREKQGEWDAAYKSVLNESDDMGPVKKKENAKLYKHKTSGKEISAVKHPGKDWELSEDNMTLHPNQQKLDLNKNKKLDSQDFKMLRAKKPMEEENVPKTDPYAEQQAGSISTVSKPKPTSVTPADQSALTKKIQSVVKEAKAANPYAIGMAAVKKSTGDEPPMEKKNIMKAHDIAKKIIAKKLEEGFNNRHSLSVTASAEKQTVAEQMKARSDYGVGAIPAPKNAAARRSEIDKKMQPVADTVLPFVPGIGTAKSVYDYATGKQGALDTAIDVGASVLGPLAKGAYKAYKYARGAKNVANAATDASKVATAADRSASVTSAGQKYANAADELSAAERSKFQRTLDAKMAAGGPAKKPVSQAAREPAADAAKAKPQPATQTTTQVGGARDASGNRVYNKAISDLVDKAAAKPSVAKASQTSVTRTTANPNSPIAKAVRDANAAREPTAVDKFIAKAKETPVTPAGKQPNVSNSGAGIRGTFRDKIAKARQNAGSDPKARQLPALRRTTEPTNYVRPGLPAVRPTPSTALARPGMPNLGTGGATRIVGLSNKAKAGLAAASAAGLAGYAAYKNMGGTKPAVSSTTSTTKDQSRVPQTGTQSVLPQTMQRGAEQDKVGVKRVEPVNAAPAQAPAPAPAQAPPKPAATAPAQAPAPATRPAAQAPAPVAKKETEFTRMMRRSQNKNDVAGTPGRRY